MNIINLSYFILTYFSCVINLYGMDKAWLQQKVSMPRIGMSILILCEREMFTNFLFTNNILPQE